MRDPKTKRFRLLIFSVLLVLTVGLLAGCAAQTRKFSIETTASITIENRQTHKHMAVTDAETIRKITDNMNRITFRKGKSSVPNRDWKYSLCWCDEDGEVIKTLTIQNSSEIDYHYYLWKATGSDKIDTALYDRLLKNAK